VRPLLGVRLVPLPEVDIAVTFSAASVQVEDKVAVLAQSEDGAVEIPFLSIGVINSPNLKMY